MEGIITRRKCDSVLCCFLFVMYHPSSRLVLPVSSDSGSDRIPDRTPDWIGSDQTGIFAFGAELLL